MTDNLKKRSIFLRWGAAFLGVLLLFTILFSFFYISVEADHECEGEHCHICETMEKCETVLHEMRSTVTHGSAIVFCVALLLSLVCLFLRVQVHPTPVSSKVQMNN